jgi:MFS transporter, DHA1 family, inner membrane transport protein
VARKAIDGPNLASTLNQSAFNVGNALGPTLGAAALALGFDYRALPWIGSALALLCAATALFSRALENGEPVSVSDGHPSAPLTE